MTFKKEHLPMGLYLVATPIGSARDITLRALDILASADILVAEDTRTLRHLMDLHDIPLAGRDILSYHDHSGANRLPRILAYLLDGKSVAYTSDAGTPLIADPGYVLVREVAGNGLPVTAAPGASALITALTLGGLPTDRFFFAGFAPAQETARKIFLQNMRQIQATLVFYESPHRIARFLDSAIKVFGAERPAALCRELTKKFEEIRRLSLGQLSDSLIENPVKGEIVLLIDRDKAPQINLEELKRTLQQALEKDSMKDAVEQISTFYGVPRREVYQMALKLRQEE